MADGIPRLGNRWAYMITVFPYLAAVLLLGGLVIVSTRPKS